MMLVGRIVAGFAVGLLSMSGKFYYLPTYEFYSSFGVLTSKSTCIPIRMRSPTDSWPHRGNCPANDWNRFHCLNVGWIWLPSNA